jgi:hypothetical protein
MKQQVIEDVNIMPQLDRACGLDMHKDKIVGFISGKDGSNQEFREFGTYNCELKEIRDWLQENDIHHCLMESTGIYWMSLYAILTEVGIEVIVANPVHIMDIPLIWLPNFHPFLSQLFFGNYSNVHRLAMHLSDKIKFIYFILLLRYLCKLNLSV